MKLPNKRLHFEFEVLISKRFVSDKENSDTSFDTSFEIFYVTISLGRNVFSHDVGYRTSRRIQSSKNSVLNRIIFHQHTFGL